jgi:tetratricopeptide (TPR) repeat protein
VAATFVSQLQDLARHSPDASNLLRFLVFFDPDYIPLEMLVTGANAILESQQPSPTRSPTSESLLALIQSPVACQNAITHLHIHCLVTYHTGAQSPNFQIHDLVQFVVLEDTKHSGLDQELFELAVELVCAAFRKIEEPKSPEWWPRCELLVPHIWTLTQWQDASSKAKKALLLPNHYRGMYLSSRGRYAEAESLYESVVAEREQLFGPDDFDLFNVMHDLAWVYLCRGRYVDAEALSKRVLESRKTRLGPEHRDTLKTMSTLAEVYCRQQRLDDAETLFMQSLQSQESQFGSEDNHTLWTMNQLAVVYNSQQRYDEAESLLTRVLHVRETLLGAQHIDTLNTKLCLGNVCSSLQRYNAAATILEQVLRAWEKDLGSRHPDTLTAVSALACVYAALGRDGDAENLLEHVLGVRVPMLGLSHHLTQSDVNLLALIYERSDRLDKAWMLKQLISPSPS